MTRAIDRQDHCSIVNESESLYGNSSVLRGCHLQDIAFRYQLPASVQLVMIRGQCTSGKDLVQVSCQ
jgi:hypothetical protein